MDGKLLKFEQNLDLPQADNILNPRPSDDIDPKTNSCSYTNFKVIDATNNKKKSILYPVLSDLFTCTEVILTDVFVDTISNNKYISNIIKNLNEKYIFNLSNIELEHLKRVKNNKVILTTIKKCPDIESVKNLLINELPNLEGLEGNIELIKVPENAPRVRQQFEIANKIWPCNFHPNKILEKLITNTIFSETDLQIHINYMKIAIGIAKYMKTQNEQTACKGAVIVDPKINSIVAVGYDNRHKNKLQHCSLIAIDNVAHSQGGGAWNIETNINEDVNDKLTKKGIPEKLLKVILDLNKEQKLGAQRVYQSEKPNEKPLGPYLCTGYDVYLTHEPCIMCAMALVHSRAKRIFYGTATSEGVFKTKMKFHCVRDLNHHYDVFAGLLEDEILLL